MPIASAMFLLLASLSNAATLALSSAPGTAATADAVQGTGGQGPPAENSPTRGATVKGVVLHGQTSAPIADARVTIVELALSVSTSADGRFEFPGVAPGRYTLTVSNIGFIFVRRRVDVDPAAMLDVTVPLAEGTGTYQETVNVAADAVTRRDPGVSSIELGSAALQDLRGIAADDPVRAIQALPGVTTGDDFQAEFSVRGSAFRQVGVVIDGTAAPILFHAVRGTEDTGSISMINTDVLDHASLSLGPHPRRHGDWLGATLEFDVREGSRDRLNWRAAVGGTNAAVVVDGPILGKRGSWLVSLRKSYVDWLVRKIEPDTEGTIGFVDLHTKAVFDLTSRQQIQFTAIGGTAKYFKPTATGANAIYDARSHSALGSIGWRYTRGAAVFSQRLSFADNRFLNTGSLSQEQAIGEIKSLIWRGDVLWAVARGWTFEGGVRGEVQHSGEHVRDLLIQTNGGFRVRTDLSARVVTTVTNVWGQFTHRSPGRAVTIGGRASHDTLYRQPHVSPWIIAEQRAGGFDLTAAAGYLTQLPTAYQQGHAARALRPEETFSAEAGLGRALARGFRWRATFFGRRETDVMRRVAEDKLVDGRRQVGLPFPLYSSDLRGKSRGVDLVVERRAARGPAGWVAYTWGHTRYDDQRTGETFDGDFDQRHTLNVFVQQRLSYRMNASMKLRIGSNFPLVGYFEDDTGTLRLADERNRVRLPTYARLDLRGSRTFTFERHRLTLFVEVMNALGRRNYGQTDGSIRPNFEAVNYFEKLLPCVPSAGLLIEF